MYVWAYVCIYVCVRVSVFYQTPIPDRVSHGGICLAIWSGQEFSQHTSIIHSTSKVNLHKALAFCMHDSVGPQRSAGV